MKLALVTETYPPEVNGVAMTLHRLVSGLRQRNHEVMVVRPRRPGGDLLECLSEELLVSGLPLPGYPGLRFGLPCGERLRNAWTNWRPDLVHVATEGPLGWSASRVALRLRTPITTSFHTNFHTYTRHYRIGFMREPVIRYLRRFHSKGSATFVPTREIVDDLHRHSFRNLKILSRGVDTSHFSPVKRCSALRSHWGAASDDPVIVTVSRMAAEKNLLLVARAFAALRQKLPSARLVFVGDGPELKRMRRLFPEHIYCGVRYGEDLARHYASADLFLFASETETFGNVVTEAMASGLPVVAYDYAAANLLIQNGRNGFVAKLGEEQAFIHQVRQAGEKYSWWRDIGGAARRTALEIPWATVLDTFEQDLLRVANGIGAKKSTR